LEINSLSTIGEPVAAVAEALDLPFEHFFLTETDARWSVRCPGAGQVSANSVRSPDKDTVNEDGALVMWPAPGRMVLAVADGLGGMPDGEGASALALTALRNALHAGLGQGAEMRESILSGFDRANRAVLARGNGAGTTLAGSRIRRWATPSRQAY
jgi:serine/threonine protein phosphatase PrpC